MLRRFYNMLFIRNGAQEVKAVCDCIWFSGTAAKAAQGRYLICANVQKPPLLKNFKKIFLFFFNILDGGGGDMLYSP